MKNYLMYPIRGLSAPALLIVAQLCLPTAMRAQRPALQPVSIARAADSVAASGDTAKAIAMLDSAVRANRKDGSAWHQLGLIRWNQAKSKRSAVFISDPKVIQALTAADSALRMATQLAPDSARFWLSLTDFNGSSGVSTMTFASAGNADRAFKSAEKAGDTLLIAAAANRVGLTAWRRYEPIAKRAIGIDNRAIDLNPAKTPRRDEVTSKLNYVKPIEPPTGDVDYKTAADYFRRALQVDPTNTRFARNVYMVLGERSLWSEMMSLARARANKYPLDFQAQLARGLAAHRLGNSVEAQVAFDSALALMDDASRRRLSSITRIMQPRSYEAGKTSELRDSTAFSKLSTEGQKSATTFFWLMADPLVITPENELRNEFLARVVWADFRWTWDELNLLGADTDRGDIYIRYGPPKKEMTIAGSLKEAKITLVWEYEGGLSFLFEMTPGFLSAYTAFHDKDFVIQTKNSDPVSFANVKAARGLDSIPVMVTRFRGRSDSSDVVVAAIIPVDSMLRGVEVDRVPVAIDMRIYDRFATMSAKDTSHVTLVPDSSLRALGRSWTKSIGPGANLLRVEALQSDTRRAARAITLIPEGLPNGFGMSDILFGTAPLPRDGANVRSWRDINTVPTPGVFADNKVGIVWEIYDLAQKDGQAIYNIQVGVERVRKGISGFSARIVDGLGRTVGRESRGLNSLEIGFDRTVPAARTMVEYLTINLAEATPGDYKLQLVITDQVSGKKTSRTSPFHIR